MARNQKDFTYDNNLLLKDAGAVTASAAAQVSAAAKVLDLGLARVDGRIVVDVSAISTANADQLYGIEVQLSDTLAFTLVKDNSQVLRLGHPTVTGAAAATPAGRYELAFTNEVNGTTYRYARLFHRIVGTTPSINYIGFAVQEAF